MLSILKGRGQTPPLFQIQEGELPQLSISIQAVLPLFRPSSTYYYNYYIRWMAEMQTKRVSSYTLKYGQSLSLMLE